MTKYEIIRKLACLSGLRQKDVLFVLDNFLDLIIKSVGNDEKVDLRGFGSFYRVLKKERKLFSPIAGKEVLAPAQAVLNFKASKITKKILNNKGA